MNLDDPQDRSAAAGEYVLGTLTSAEHDAFERAMVADDGLRAEVYAWQDRLLGLTRRALPVEPPAALWDRIEAGLATAAVAPPATRAPGIEQARPAANDETWRRLRLWQRISGLAIAASIVLASLLVLRGPTPRPESARYLAVLQSPDRTSTGWIVEVTAGQRLRLVPVAESAPPPPGKALQFWTKPQGAAGPTSLGLVQPGQVTELPAASLPALGEKQLFELTLEGAKGSPIDRPTGPILFVGSTVRL